MGLFHRYLGVGILGLRESLRDNIFPKWTALAGCISRDWASPARRSDPRSAGLDRQLTYIRGVHLGVRKTAGQESTRSGAIPACIHPHHRLFRRRRGNLSAAIPAALSPLFAPALAVCRTGGTITPNGEGLV